MWANMPQTAKKSRAIKPPYQLFTLFTFIPLCTVWHTYILSRRWKEHSSNFNGFKYSRLKMWFFLSFALRVPSTNLENNEQQKKKTSTLWKKQTMRKIPAKCNREYQTRLKNISQHWSAFSVHAARALQLVKNVLYTFAENVPQFVRTFLTMSNESWPSVSIEFYKFFKWKYSNCFVWNSQEPHLLFSEREIKFIN